MSIIFIKRLKIKEYYLKIQFAVLHHRPQQEEIVTITQV